LHAHETPNNSPIRPRKPKSSRLNALVFLASEPDRLSRFMDLSGLGLDTIRASAADPGLLGGLLDYMLSDQSCS
jgi:hypothetical protein